MKNNTHLDLHAEWEQRFGPEDGRWLWDEFSRIMQDVANLSNVRIARVSDRAEMATYAEQAEAGMGESGDWQVTCPHSGVVYSLGCNWS